MGKLIKTDRNEDRRIEAPRKQQSRLLAFLNDDAVMFGELRRANNLTVILLFIVFTIHNPMPAITLAIVLSLGSILRKRDTKSDHKKDDSDSS